MMQFFQLTVFLFRPKLVQGERIVMYLPRSESGRVHWSQSHAMPLIRDKFDRNSEQTLVNY